VLKKSLCLLLLAFSLTFSFFVTAQTTSTEAVEKETKNNKTTEHYVYSVYYKFMNTGKIFVDIEHNNNDIIMSSFTDLSLLGISFGGKQTSKITYKGEEKGYITQSTIRKSVGFSSVDLSAHFIDDGHRVDVVEDGKKTSYINKDNIIRDYNALSLNIEAAIRQGKTEFDFYVQTSDDISHYFFSVAGNEKIETKYGHIEVIRVNQIKKDDRTFSLWFAPSIHGKMVKYHYKRHMLDIKGELIDYSHKISKCSETLETALLTTCAKQLDNT
jgi:hypothetical protein